jgi:WD40 repeat protein/transcriptional regulator with XRE-family HTH domain
LPDRLFPPKSFETFGDLLKYLRRRERLTQLELSMTVGYSEAQIGRLEKNQRRPDLTALQALFIPALQIENEPEMIAYFLELARSARQEDAPVPGIAPYKGLLFFDVSDAELFFGRETLVAHLVERVSGLGIDSSSRFLAVVGASGSGKSSLMRAGLAVALKSAGWNVRVFIPGAAPLKTLERQLELNQDKIQPDRLFILVDQFEETFTLCRAESERFSFIEKLLGLTQDSSRKTVVVIALRADFYSNCAQYPLLREAVAAEQVFIGQMSREALRRAVEEPAKYGGWEFEPGLVNVLLNDIGAQGTSEPEPGALPLLSHALLATWERRRGRTFTLDGYHASGGVHGAIAETAESVFTDLLNQAQQEIARDVFLRLTELGEGTQDTRRRVALKELVRQSAEETQLRVVLNTLAEARLITLNEDNAEVSHEALIREWHRLHEWLMQDREGLLLHRHLTESAHEWEARGHDPAELYRGARLAQVREWVSTNEERLNAPERAFIAASLEQEQHDALEREAQRQRQLEAAQKLAETEKRRAEQEARAARQLRRGAVTLAVVLALAVIAAVTAGVFAKRNAANQTRSQAQRLAAGANSLLLGNGDTNLIALLSIRSLTMQYSPYGDAMLSSLTTLEALPREFPAPPTQNVTELDFSPNGRYLVTGNDQSARLWDLISGETIRVFSGHNSYVSSVAFSPDGKYLLTGSQDGTARLWDVATGSEVQVYSGEATGIFWVAFSPDGKTIAATGENTARLWDATTGQTLHVISGHSGPLAFSPDGKYLLTGSDNQTAKVWDIAAGREMQVFSGHTGNVNGVAYSPDGKTIATASDDLTAVLWDVTTGQEVREFRSHQGAVNDVRFSPNGRFLFTASEDGIARLWDLATAQTIRVFTGHAGAALMVKFSPDGRLAGTTAEDGITRVWDLQAPSPGGMLLTGHNSGVLRVAFSPDGKQAVTASVDNTARIWDIASGQTLVTITGHTDAVRSVTFSPDGKMVLTAGADRTARLWDAASGQELRRFEGHKDFVNDAVFSPDGKYVATASFDGTARVWNAQTGQATLIYDGTEVGISLWTKNLGTTRVSLVAFSPDGKTIASAGDDGVARIWDPRSGEDLMIFEGHTDGVIGIDFSPDGKYLVTSSFDGTVRLWEIASGREVRRLAGLANGEQSYSNSIFSPDGKYVLAGSEDGTARLWEAQRGREVRRFTGHNNPVTGVAFSPDGRSLLTASQDRTARLWFVDYHDTLRSVCAVVTRDLTPEERSQFDITDQRPTCPAQ